MKPPISYYGGKQRMSKYIIPLIPKHMIYVEPFAGGCAILFNKPYPKVTNNDHYHEVINDLDGRLVNFFVQLRDNGDELIRRLRLTLYSEEEHRISKNMDTDDPIENARRYYVNIRQSFSNKLNSGWVRNRSGNNSPLIWKNNLKNLNEYIDRMQSVYICNTDAIKCIEQWDTPDTFFYCDPPYVGFDQGHYKGYTESDLKALCEALKNIKGSFILSGYDSDIPSDDWEKHKVKAYSSAALKRDNTKRTEVIWRKISDVPPRGVAKTLYASGKFDCYRYPQMELGVK